MSKSIATLAEDMEAILDSGFIPNEENLEILADNLKNRLRQQFTDWLEVGEPKSLRMSNLGKGKRSLYYDLKEKNPKEEKHDAQTRMKFLVGDLIEQLLVLLIKESGHTIEGEQLELEIDGVKGHPDGIVDGVPLDIKTASTFSYLDKFARGNLVNGPDSDPFGYIGQISAYAQALGKDEAAFLAMDKQHGSFCVLHIDEMDMIDAQERIAEIREAVEKDELPERCYEPKEHDNGNIELNSNCFYCRHKHTCWSDANEGQGIRTFQYSNKKVDLIHVEKLPRVEEIL